MNPTETDGGRTETGSQLIQPRPPRPNRLYRRWSRSQLVLGEIAVEVRPGRSRDLKAPLLMLEPQP
jgi:hypothetical protein